ncbi:MAG: leucine-rich repeat domain-containing protein [Clostridia bacterium]|nr:leucine-rich repeat domain-containing protein [Clostridia bacterium]
MKKFTKILSLALCLLMTLSLLLSCNSKKEETNNNNTDSDTLAQTLEGDFYDEKGLYYVSLDASKKTCEVSVGRATDVKKIEIPATYNGYTVTNIAQAGFANCEKLESITIPASVEVIEDLAFQNSTNLAEIKLANNAKLKKIGYGVFKNTAYYANEKQGDTFYFGKYFIEADKTVTSCEIKDGTKFISGYAFSNCTALTTVTIPASVKYIDSFAFNNCKALKRVNISDLKAWCSIEFADHSVNPLSMIAIASKDNVNGLYLNGSLVTVLNISSNITTISDYAFYGYKGLAEIHFSTAIKTIGNGAFGDLNLNSLIVTETDDKTGESYQVQYYKVFFAGNQNDWKNVKKTGAGLPGNDHIDFAK